jgi:hypothetical protein
MQVTDTKVQYILYNGIVDNSIYSHIQQFSKTLMAQNNEIHKEHKYL